MSTDELARRFIANIERQQRAQSTGRFPWIREASARAPYFSAGTRLQPTSGGRIHCEECGLRTNGQAICSGCHASPTRLWLQFVSLGTLVVLTAYNYIFALNLLPTLAPRGHLASVWLNVSEFTWLYGWIVIGAYLPAWAYYGRKKYGYSLKAGVRVGIGFVVILLIGAVAAHISADGMDLGGTPRNFVGFPPGTRNRCRLGDGNASAGFYLLQLRVTGPTPG